MAEEAQTKGRIFEYAVLYHPTSDEKKKGEKSRIIVDVGTGVFLDGNAAGIYAARQIPEEFAEKLDRVEVAVRPF